MKKIEINKIYNQNCIEGMKLIPKNKIDLVITDPHLLLILKQKKPITIELLLMSYLDTMKSSLKITIILHSLG